MQPSHSSRGTHDRGLNPPIQPRRPKLLAQLRQAVCPRHYSRRDESLVQKAVREAVVRAGLTKRVTRDPAPADRLRRRPSANVSRPG